MGVQGEASVRFEVAALGRAGDDEHVQPAVDDRHVDRVDPRQVVAPDSGQERLAIAAGVDEPPTLGREIRGGGLRWDQVTAIVSRASGAERAGMVVTDDRSRVGAEAQREEVEDHEAGDGDDGQKRWEEGFHRSDSRFGLRLLTTA